MSSVRLPQSVVDARELLKGKVSIENGAVSTSITEEEIVAHACEKHGVTKDQFKAVQDYSHAVGAAFALEVGEISKAAFDADKNAQSFKGDLKIGNTTVSAEIVRQKTFRNPQDADKPIVKEGHVSVDYNVETVLSTKSINKATEAFWKGLSD